MSPSAAIFQPRFREVKKQEAEAAKEKEDLKNSHTDDTENCGGLPSSIEDALGQVIVEDGLDRILGDNEILQRSQELKTDGSRQKESISVSKEIPSCSEEVPRVKGKKGIPRKGTQKIPSKKCNCVLLWNQGQNKN